ncbi:EAL domain-containing protein [Sulfitobacter aestuariivivens]|uniref:EAL domain-containing protein n=1 Tax=Sulfitobacter aestuariivivens TaxID=2766981 RepID=UPI0031B5CE50
MANQLKRRFVDTPVALQSPLNHAVNQRDRSVLQMVRDAVRHKQTLLAYQPVMLAQNPDRVAFHEGLMRLLDETGRIIPAADFMPVIEDNELGRDIDVLALRMGLMTLQQNPDLRLSINMSARSIGYRAWNDTMRRFMKRDATLGERLILEITESSAMQVPEIVADFMAEMQEFGVCFALDDFGAGQTAIRYFRDFFFDLLKIDGQFVRGIAQDADNRALMGAMLSIAKHFDMLVVAESVENPQDAAVLADMGVDCLQGYYFSAPTTRPAWLRSARRQAAG